MLCVCVHIACKTDMPGGGGGGGEHVEGGGGTVMVGQNNLKNFCSCWKLVTWDTFLWRPSFMVFDDTQRLFLLGLYYSQTRLTVPPDKAFD